MMNMKTKILLEYCWCLFVYQVIQTTKISIVKTVGIM